MQDKSREIGERAEEVAEWYFRLNGFFLIPGFVVHPDITNQNPRTEADLLGIRLSFSAEGVQPRVRRQSSGRSGGFRPMEDDQRLITPSKDGTVPKHLVAMVEVKSGECSINGPWTRQEDGNMNRALSRVGFGNQPEVAKASDEMYKNLRYVGQNFIVQYFAVGGKQSLRLAQTYPNLVQITFADIGEFLLSRFHKFPEKIPPHAVFNIWKGFGYAFMRWFESTSRWGHAEVTSEQCVKAVEQYIREGSVALIRRS